MNLRELWDTVVLRDILGYIFPGCITLLAVALLLRDLEVADTWNALSVCHNRGLAGLILLLVERPGMLLVIGPLAYAVGYLQSWIADIFEGKFPCSNLGRLALRYLRDERGERSYDYLAGAFAVFGVPSRDLPDPVGDDPLSMLIWQAKAHPRNPASLNCSDCHEAARNQAYELWRLCDYYLMARVPDIHSMYAGRYYVLTVLFTNLGLSTILLGLVLMVPLIGAAFPYAPLALALLACMPMLLILWCWPWRKTLDSPMLPSWYIHAWEGLVVLVLIILSTGLPMLRAGSVSLALGLLFLERSVNYRKNFVERVFPMFYAVTRSVAEQGPPD